MTDRYAVIGNPISHSKSPLVHGGFARQSKQDMVYTTLEAPLEGFAAAVTAFRSGGGRGLNVTTPFKLEALAYATERGQRARLAGAVNCMKFEGDKVLAENFDGVGLVNDIQSNLGFRVAGRRVLLLGAGGAARGAIGPLLEERPAKLVIANRMLSKAQALEREFSAHGKVAAAGYPDLASERFDIVLNCTSASQRGELPPVPKEAFSAGCLAYELVYGKGLTPFLRFAREAGAARLADGVGMLVEQAAEAFLWWRGVRPETRPMIEAIAVPLT
jgi:shikimate dehydrogenase